MYQIANMQQMLQMDQDTVIASYYKAYQYDSTRAEPFYRLANYHLQNGKVSLAYTLTKQGIAIPFPHCDRYFTEQWVYEYGLLLTLANCAFELKRYEEAKEICCEILAKSELTAEIRQSVAGNLRLLESMGIK